MNQNDPHKRILCNQPPLASTKNRLKQVRNVNIFRADLLLLFDSGISAEDSTKDLGVAVNSIFQTSLNYQQAVNRILFQLCHGFAVLTSEIFGPLYLALVRPIVEYGQQA